MQDALKEDWLQILREFPPLLSPKQVEEASQQIVTAKDVYQRDLAYRRRLDLDVRRIGGRLYVTRQSLLDVLCGEKQLAL